MQWGLYMIVMPVALALLAGRRFAGRWACVAPVVSVLAPRKRRIAIDRYIGIDVHRCATLYARLTDMERLRPLRSRSPPGRPGDVARVIGATAAGAYDAIVLDLYEGPRQATNRASHPVYGRATFERARRPLRPGGVLAIWSEEPDRPFEARLGAAGFDVQRQVSGRGGRAHTIYVGARRPRG